MSSSRGYTSYADFSARSRVPNISFTNQSNVRRYDERRPKKRSRGNSFRVSAAYREVATQGLLNRELNEEDYELLSRLDEKVKTKQGLTLKELNLLRTFKYSERAVQKSPSFAGKIENNYRKSENSKKATQANELQLLKISDSFQDNSVHLSPSFNQSPWNNSDIEIISPGRN